MKREAPFKLDASHYIDLQLSPMRPYTADVDASYARARGASAAADSQKGWQEKDEHRS